QRPAQIAAIELEALDAAPFHPHGEAAHHGFDFGKLGHSVPYGRSGGASSRLLLWFFHVGRSGGRRDGFRLRARPRGGEGAARPRHLREGGASRRFDERPDERRRPSALETRAHSSASPASRTAPA